MLKDIMKSIKKDGYISKSMLARELSTTEDMIGEGIDQLLRMGYIIKEETGESCSTTCVSCPFAKTCNMGIVKMYRVTNKGMGVVN